MCSAILLLSLVSAVESDYCKVIARQEGARVEVSLFDGTRADLVGREWIGEVDFARKWAKGIGQAAYYSAVTDKPGRLYLIYREDEARFVHRAIIAAKKADILVIPKKLSDLRGHLEP